MAKIPDVSLEAWKPLYSEAVVFAALKPWEHFDDGTIFGVQDPKTGQMGYACILGALGELHALCVYRGPEGYDVHRRMRNNEFRRRPEDVVALQNCLFAEYADREELDKADLGTIRRLGLSFRGPKAWPLFRSHLPGFAPWHLTEDEAGFLTFALRCASGAASKAIQGALQLDAKPGEVFCHFQGADGSIQTRWEPAPIHRPQPPAPVVIDDAALSAIKSKPTQTDSAWEADIWCMPSALTDRDRPYFPRFTLVAHQESGFIIHNGIALPESAPHQALADALVEAIIKSGRMPNEIQLRDESFAACLAPLGKALGIKLKPGKLKMVREARKELEKYMRSGKLPSLEPEPKAAKKTAGRPGPRAAEKALFDLSRAIRENDFESEEELDAWLQDVAADEDLKKAAPESALEVAQSVMYEAWEAEDPDRAVELAERALEISPNCADAYDFLAEEAGAVEPALDLYRKGVEAGERSLGKKFFKENAGHFWGMLETRGYMRCRSGLAGCLWELKRHDEALGHYEEMLRLNPGDNQGIRYIVLACLGELGRFDELDKFMGRPDYQDDCSAEWLYTKALMEFRRGGPSESAVAALRAAAKHNKYAPDYLTGKKSIPRRLPDMITMGGENEAYTYASRFLPTWRRVAGASEWLRAESDKAAPPKAGRNEPCPCGSRRKFKKCCGRDA